MRADVFCRVIDNFGDIGVTWRLARQLTSEFHWEIRLWVDNLASFARIEPRLDPGAATQSLAGVNIRRWPQAREDPHIEPAKLVIAAFSCEPPPGVVQRMHSSPTVLVNLEYLSAEPWVEGCHALPALRADGLNAHYFFPGFNARTGGLPREAALAREREDWIGNRAGQRSLLARAGLSDHGMQLWDAQAGTQLVTLFCYPHAPVAALVDSLTALRRPTLLVIPGGATLPPRKSETRGTLQIERIDFLTQPDYDRLLWMADLNFVRGEDSIVRAIWAGKPAVWQLYPQADAAHLAKLEAWLAIAGLPSTAQAANRGWNATPEHVAAVKSALEDALSPVNFATWSDATQRFRQEQMRIPDLASSLDLFCRKKLEALAT